MLMNSLMPFVPVKGSRISVTAESAETTGFKKGGLYAITNVGSEIAYVNVENAAATTACLPISPSEKIAKIAFPYTSLFCIGDGSTTLVVNEIVDADEYR